MKLAVACLQDRAKKLELQELETIKFTSSFLTKFDALLEDAYGILSPTPNDCKVRQELVQIFNFMTEEIYGNANGFPKVEAFGSFTMDMFNAKSDLDLSINFGNDTAEFPRKDIISTLKKFKKRLYALQRGGHVSCIQPIMTARVPVLKVVDCGTGIECDLSVENKYGIAKSKILAVISSIDERFQKLSFLMKTWCKAHDINSSKDRTLNSLSIISLVAFHLQTRDPPILPPFASLFKERIDLANLENVVQGYQQFGKGNQESLAELFVTLFVKLSSVETLWQYGLCVSTYTGSWISKTWETEFDNMSVQDFMEQSQNTARSVGKSQLQKIYKCIHGTLGRLVSFMNGQIEDPQMKNLLFGPDALLAPGLPFIYSASLKQRQKPGDSNQKKKAKKARNTKSARSNEVSDLSKFISKGVDGTSLAASKPNNELGHTGDNNCLGGWVQLPQTGSPHPQIEFVGSAAQNSTASNSSISQQPQTVSQHSSMRLDRQHIPNPVDQTTSSMRCIPTAHTKSQHPQIGFVGSAAQISTVSKPGVSQWPQWPRTESQHPSMTLSRQHLPNPKFQKTDTGLRCVPITQTGSQHLQTGFVGLSSQNSTTSNPSVSKQLQHLQIGLVGSADQSSTIRSPGVSQWPQWCQTGSQHPSMGFGRQHSPNPLIQNTNNWQTCTPNGDKQSVGSPQLQGVFFRPHGSNQLILMPHSLQGCNFSVRWGAHVYSSGHL